MSISISDIRAMRARIQRNLKKPKRKVIRIKKEDPRQMTIFDFIPGKAA